MKRFKDWANGWKVSFCFGFEKNANDAHDAETKLKRDFMPAPFVNEDGVGVDFHSEREGGSFTCVQSCRGEDLREQLSGRLLSDALGKGET